MGRASDGPTLSALVAAESQRAGPRCGVEIVSEQLDPSMRDEFASLVNSDPKEVPASALSRALRQLDPPVSLNQNAITRHRRGDCACTR